MNISFGEARFIFRQGDPQPSSPDGGRLDRIQPPTSVPSTPSTEAQAVQHVAGAERRLGTVDQRIEQGSHIPREAPIISEQGRASTAERLESARHDIGRLLGFYEQLRNNNLETFEQVESRHPRVAEYLHAAQTIAEQLSDRNARLSNDEIMVFTDQYNYYARLLNNILGNIPREEKERSEELLRQASRGELNFDERQFTEREKTELHRFVRDLWEELFPMSNVDRFVMWASGVEDKSLLREGVGRVLMIPANGIEDIVMGFVRMFNPRTYGELSNAIHTGVGMSYEDWCGVCRTIKYTFENLPATETISPIISMLIAIATLVGGTGRIISVASKLRYSTAFIGTLESVLLTRSALTIGHLANNSLPVAAMAGITLPYIE